MSSSKFVSADLLSLEKLADAHIKNRAELTQLTTELHRLEKEKQNEMRMVNNEIQRFKAKYSKTNFGTDSTEASSVKMYETHNPGFCFKRNGEHRVQQIVESKPSIDFEHLHFLLFTNGEVDIEKVLCLHLLSIHATNHLIPPQKVRNNSNNFKKDSPLEQLIERSKENSKNFENVLPTYVLDVGTKEKCKNLVDERLSSRLLVNEKILELIMTVISALQNSNPEKVQQLISIAEDPSQLKRIFRKQYIQDFVMTLKNHSLINSCSSFILTQPLKTDAQHLDIRTPSGALEDLVQFIRSNVLQFPTHEDLRTLETESRELVATPGPSMPTSKQPLVEDVSRFKRKDINYIQKNRDSISTYKKLNTQDEDVTTKTKKRIDKKTEDIKNKNSNSVGNKFQPENVKVHLKQTKCPACMEKWKAPLPEPKVAKLSLKSEMKAESSGEYINLNLVKTDSRRRVLNLIEKEQYKLNSYDRKYSNPSTVLTQNKKKTISQSGSLDLVALNVIDLEKIRHEIREKETKKKLEKFLQE